MSPRPNPQTSTAAPGLPLDAEVITPAVSPATPETLAALQTLKPQPAAQARPAAPAATPMALLQIAMDQGADLDRLERLMQMQERWQEGQAREAFNRAFAAFKAESIAIVKNISVADGPLKGKKYADLFAVVSAITPAMSKHGLSFNWRLTRDEAAWLEVTCTVRHEAGHSETVSMGGPPDTGGAKNAIQARASAKSYLERYTLLAITGLAAQDQDDDGRGGPKGTQMPEDEFQRHRTAILGAATLDALQKAFVAGYNASAQDTQTRQALTRLKDQRKAELQGGAR